MIPLYQNPWVGGTHAVAFLGSVTVDLFVAHPVLGDLIELVTTKLREMLAKNEHVNAAVGCEIEMDPFAELDGASGVAIQMRCTAARLRHLTDWSSNPPLPLPLGDY